jgi:hypothetical protein
MYGTLKVRSMRILYKQHTAVRETKNNRNKEQGNGEILKTKGVLFGGLIEPQLNPTKADQQYHLVGALRIRFDQQVLQEELK